MTRPEACPATLPDAKRAAPAAASAAPCGARRGVPMDALQPLAARIRPSRRWRVLAVAVGMVAVCAAALATPARAGTFRVSQCNAVDQGGLWPRGYQAALWSVRNGWPEVECAAGGAGIRIATGNWRLLNDWDTTARLALPASMPGTELRTAWLDWRFNPQSPSTNPAFLNVVSTGARLLVARPGDGTFPGAAMRRDLPAGARDLEFNVWCSPVNGPGWCNWPGHLLDLRGLTVELEESGEPSAEASGPLLGGGPHAGVEPVEIRAVDADSGVRHVDLTLGGAPAGSLAPADGCRDDRLPPCPQALRGTVDVDTGRVPDGPRRLRLTVTDAAGNVRTLDVGTVLVANQPPRVDTAPQDGTGGPGSGSSGAGGGEPVAGAPAGTAPAPSSGSPRPAPFPANPLAGRGHAPNGSGASGRARLRAWLEPPATPAGTRRPLRRRATTVPYGVRVRVRGRLTGARGRPIGRAVLAAVRREPGGPWRAVTGVRTRSDGRFTTFTRIGPSQAIRFVYYPYGDAVRGRRSATLRVRVRGR